MINYLSPFIAVLAVLASVVAAYHVMKITDVE